MDIVGERQEDGMLDFGAQQPDDSKEWTQR